MINPCYPAVHSPIAPTSHYTEYPPIHPPDSWTKGVLQLLTTVNHPTLKPFTRTSQSQLSSRWYLRAWKSPHMLQPSYQKFPQRCRSNSSNVRLNDDGPLSSIGHLHHSITATTCLRNSCGNVGGSVRPLHHCQQATQAPIQPLNPSQKDAPPRHQQHQQPGTHEQSFIQSGKSHHAIDGAESVQDGGGNEGGSAGTLNHCQQRWQSIRLLPLALAALGLQPCQRLHK